MKTRGGTRAVATVPHEACLTSQQKETEQHGSWLDHCSWREVLLKREDPLILNEYLRNCGNITLKPHHLKNIVGGANAAYRNESAWFATYVAGTLSVSNTIFVMRSRWERASLAGVGFFRRNPELKTVCDAQSRESIMMAVVRLEGTRDTMRPGSPRSSASTLIVSNMICCMRPRVGLGVQGILREQEGMLSGPLLSSLWRKSACFSPPNCVIIPSRST